MSNTIPPDTRVLGSANPPTDMNNVANILSMLTGQAAGSTFTQPYSAVPWFNVVTYGADPTDTADSTTAIQAAVNACISAGGGVVYIPKGIYKTTSTITVLANGCSVSIIGDGLGISVLDYYGNGDCLWMKTTTAYTTGPFLFGQAWSGNGIKGVTINGSNHSAGNSTGLHISDLVYFTVDVEVITFNQGTYTSGDIGVHVDNQYFWTERLRGSIVATGCTTGVCFDQTPVGPEVTGSVERTDLVVWLDTENGSFDGVCLRNGTYIVDGKLDIRGNIATNGASSTTAAVLRLTGSSPVGSVDVGTYSNLQFCTINIGVETGSGSAANCQPYTVYLGTGIAGGNSISYCNGNWNFLQTGTYTFQPTNGMTIGTGQAIFFEGPIQGDANLQASASEFWNFAAGIFAGSTSYMGSVVLDGALSIASSGAGQIGILGVQGAGDGTQFSNIVIGNTANSDEWVVSYRTSNSELLFYYYNGTGYVSPLVLTTAGALSSSSNVLDDGAGNTTINGAFTANSVSNVGQINIYGNADMQASTAVNLAAGTATVAPISFTSGTNLTAATAGAVEHDSVATYMTNETTSGRGLIPVEQKFRLTTAGGTISTIANYFGSTSNISLVSGAEYEIEVDFWFLVTTTDTVTWTFTNSAAPTSMNMEYKFSPLVGIVSTAGSSSLFGEQYNITSATATVTTGSLTSAAEHHHKFWIRLINGTGTSLKIQATKNTGGTITPGIGSSWKCRRVPAANVGTFSA